MKSETKITIVHEDSGKFFGEGPLELLNLVQSEGSLRAAAIKMEMSYSKAFNLVKKAENCLGFPVCTRAIGGKHGGGSFLTKEAQSWLSRYEQYKEECRNHNNILFQKMFCEYRTGCVIMASGLGKRFGGNKLMAELNGKPLISYVLNTVQSVFPKITVVTRNKELSEFCQSEALERNRPINIIFHSESGKNDALRLAVESLSSETDGCFFFQADQPFISKETIERMLSLVRKDNACFYRTEYNGAIGTPVYFPKRVFDELKRITEDKGGSPVLLAHEKEVIRIPVFNEWELKDIDTPEELANAANYLKQSMPK